MSIQLLNIGFGNMVSANRVIAIISPESAPIKRMVQDARDKSLLIDATYGRKTRAVLVMDSGQIVLSAIQPWIMVKWLVQHEVDEDTVEA